MLALFVRPYLSDDQHGYQVGKGTLTAWASVVQKLKEPNIYEFDLKQFFPRVNTQYLSRKLLEDCGMPVAEVY